MYIDQISERRMCLDCRQQHNASGRYVVRSPVGHIGSPSCRATRPSETAEKLSSKHRDTRELRAQSVYADFGFCSNPLQHRSRLHCEEPRWAECICIRSGSHLVKSVKPRLQKCLPRYTPVGQEGVYPLAPTRSPSGLLSADFRHCVRRSLPANYVTARKIQSFAAKNKLG